MKYFIRIILFLGLIISSVSCGNKTKSQDNNSKFVKYYTKGIISNSEDILIKIDNSLLVKELKQSDLNNLFSFEPEISGHAERVSANEFTFIPDKRLQFNTSYKAKFRFNSILSEPITNDFNFEFATRELKFNVTTKAFNSYSKNLGKFRTQITVNDFVSVKEVKSILKADPALNANFKFSNPDDFVWNEFNVVLDSIVRQVEDKEYSISYNATDLDSDSKNDYKIVVPGKNRFRILNVEINTDPTQEIVINFSDPILPNQNFEGLVQINGESNLSYSVSKSELKVYFSKKIKAKKELTILKGLKNEDNYPLKKDWLSEVVFEQLKPQVNLLSSNATILPNSSGLKLNFTSQKLRGINVKISRIHSNNIMQFLQDNSYASSSNIYNVGNEIYNGKLSLFEEKDPEIQKLTTHALDLEKVISVDPGAIYRVTLSFHPDQVEYTCDASESGYDKYKQFVKDFDSERPYANTSYDDRRWNNRNNPCNISFYLNNLRKHESSMNVFASNLGLTIKKDQKNNIQAFVVDMVTNELISGADVSIYTYQQQLINSAQTTMGSCLINIPKDEEPYFVIVKYKTDYMYMKIQNGNSLSLSNFDVSGGQIQNGIKGFTYLERGVRRPGDKIPVTFILDDTENPIPNDQPILFKLYDPEGKLVNQKTVTEHLNQMYSADFMTKKEDKTGNWRVSIQVGGSYFSKTIKVETVKPNRLKIKTTFTDQNVLDISKTIEGKISSTWLHGAIAKDLKADVMVKLQARNTTFKGYEKFNFNHSYKRFQFDDLQIFNGQLDNKGEVNFSHQFNLGNRSPGFLKANFITKVYEKGGDFSTNVISKNVSAYPAYVGVSIPKGQGYSNTIVTDKKHTVDIVCLNEDAKPLSKRKLKTKIFKIDWSWWWQSRRHGISNYVNNKHHSEVFSKTILTDNNGKASFDFEIFQPEWGRFLVVVEDEKGGHVSSQTIYIDWPEWIGRSRGGPTESSNELNFTTDKDIYDVNDVATVTIPSAEEGKVLISIENGIEVIETRWLDTKKGETKFELPISKNMTPNVYIVINHLQKHKNTSNDLPMRLYGVKGIEVINPETKLEPKIKMPKELKPEKTFNLKVSENQGKAMSYTIQIVDDGLLDLTNYKTPNPWNTFYSKTSLGVRTWDIYDNVIGAYGGTVNQILAIGGDGDLAGGKSKSANRFKPVAIHLGPFQLESHSTETHKITLPNYIGSVRTMIVASNTESQSYGNVSETTPVKKALMVLASVPRKLTPTERFTLPVNVFVMDLSAKKVKVELKTNESFRIIGSSKKTIEFKETGDQIVNFEVEVLGGNPIGKIDIKASAGKEIATTEVEIDVVNPNLSISKLENFEIKPNASLEIPYKTFGDKGSNTLDLEFTDFPSFNMNGRLRNLIGYPYGCLEQTTSKAFPQLSLLKVRDLSSELKTKIDKHIKFAINKLVNFQRPNGGLSYWPHSNYYESWAEIFAGHFLIEAEKNGYKLPFGFKEMYLRQLKELARKNNSLNSRYSTLRQAYRLYVLALAGQSDLSAMNRLRENKYLNSTAKYRLAQAYALIGQKSIAISLVENASKLSEKENYNYYRQTFGSRIRDKAFELETYNALDMPKEAGILAKEISKKLNSKDWLSTQTTAIALKAMSSYAMKINSDGINFSYYLNNELLDKVSKQKGGEFVSKEMKQGEYTLKIENHKNKTLFVSLVNGGLPTVGQETNASRGLNVSVSYKDMDGNLISIDSLKQGFNFYAELFISNTTTQSLNNVALSQIFPSGWEIINNRFSEDAITERSSANFMDIRDDRVNYFMSLASKGSKKFSVLLNASYLGNYYLPGAHAEAMYDNDYLVKLKGKRINVIP